MSDQSVIVRQHATPSRARPCVQYVVRLELSKLMAVSTWHAETLLVIFGWTEFIGSMTQTEDI